MSKERHRLGAGARSHGVRDDSNGGLLALRCA